MKQYIHLILLCMMSTAWGMNSKELERMMRKRKFLNSPAPLQDLCIQQYSAQDIGVLLHDLRNNHIPDRLFEPLVSSYIEDSVMDTAAFIDNYPLRAHNKKKIQDVVAQTRYEPLFAQLCQAQAPSLRHRILLSINTFNPALAAQVLKHEPHMVNEPIVYHRGHDTVRGTFLDYIHSEQRELFHARKLTALHEIKLIFEKHGGKTLRQIQREANETGP